MSSTPSPSLIQLTAVEVSPESAPAPAATKRTTTVTAVRPMIQPARNVGPFCRARSLKSMRITPMMGTGLMATPMAKGSTSPMAEPMVIPPVRCG
jgi:hypothetical protein